MKKLMTRGVGFIALALATLPSYAAATDSLTGIEFGTATGLGSRDVREGVMQIVNVLLGFLGVIAIVIILWGGFRWMTAGGNDENVSEAKKIITAGIIGLVIIFISYALAQFVIEQLITATDADNTGIPG